MTDIRELLDREVQGLRAPEAWEPVHRRTRQRHRRRRLGAAVLALVVAGAGTAGAWLAIGGLRNNKNPKRPAAASSPEQQEPEATSSGVVGRRADRVPVRWG